MSTNNSALETAKVWACRFAMIGFALFYLVGAIGAVSPEGSGNVALALLLAFCSGGVFTFTVLHW